MMFFAKYLLERGIITADQLIEAMALQMESLPSLIGLIHREALRSSDEIIDVLQESLENNRSFEEVIIEKEWLSREELELIFAKQMEKGKGIGEILLAKGWVTVGEIDECIRDYNTKKEKKENDRELTDEEAMDAFEQMEVRGQREEGEEEEGVLKLNLNGEYLKVFDSAFLEKINGKIDQLEKKVEEKDIISLCKETTLLITIATMAELENSVQLLNLLPDLLESLKREGKSEVIYGLREMVSLLWDLRVNIATRGGEKEITDDIKWKEKYSACVEWGKNFEKAVA